MIRAGIGSGNDGFRASNQAGWLKWHCRPARLHWLPRPCRIENGGLVKSSGSPPRTPIHLDSRGYMALPCIYNETRRSCTGAESGGAARCVPAATWRPDRTIWLCSACCATSPAEVLAKEDVPSCRCAFTANTTLRRISFAQNIVGASRGLGLAHTAAPSPFHYGSGATPPLRAAQTHPPLAGWHNLSCPPSSGGTGFGHERVARTKGRSPAPRLPAHPGWSACAGGTTAAVARLLSAVASAEEDHPRRECRARRALLNTSATRDEW